MSNGPTERSNNRANTKKSKRISKVILDDELQIVRKEQYYGNQNFQNRYTRNREVSEPETYDDYYDFPSKEGKDNSTKLTVVIASVIVAVLALVFVGLALLNPREHVPENLVMATTAADETSEIETAAVNSAFSASEAPVIYGVNPIIVYEGNPVTYKAGVYVEDDNDPAPTLEIDNEMVDLTTPGTYAVTYIARDKDQNETREMNTVTVLAGADLIEEDKIFALADEVLASIITDDITTDEMKCLKVYEFLHAIGYVDEVHSEDWMQNAYWMLMKRGGDCFCYYSASRLLLTRLGYEVMEVRNNNNYVHYWCLVSLDGGETWWHFDPCCWSWGEDGILCLVSDQYLSEFTRRHMTSDGRLIHAWDQTKYPATPEEDFWTDEDRAVIYESGLIDPDAEYDPSVWANEGWEFYQIPYSYEIPETFYYYDAGYDAGYDMGYDADYQWSDTGDWSMADDAQIVSEDAAVPEENGEIAEDPGTYEGAEATFEDYAAVGEY